MPKVSVIIPVYNTEEYLPKCLKSLTKQTLKDIEIICINDGSTDNSLSILENFARKDSRIKVTNQEHKKQGAARNRGIELASGEYIGYVDSDDWVNENFYENLYSAAIRTNSDIAMGTNIRIGNGRTKKRINIDKEKIVTGLEEKFELCNLFKDQCPTNKIYRRNLLLKNNIVWPEDVYCEDKIYTLKSVYYANSVIAVPDAYYYYFRRTNSTVKSKVGSFSKNQARKEMLNFLRTHCPNIGDKKIWAVKKELKVFGITLYKIKESLKSEKHYFLGVLPYLIKQEN